MRRILVLVGLAVVIGLMLTGCMQQVQPEEVGGISITIPPRSSNHMLSVGPKMIPANAEFIRVRICTSWVEERDFNMVVTIPLLPEGSTTDISIPAGTGYIISAISYLESDGENYALTCANSSSVTILAGTVTPVTLILEPWTYTFTGVIPWATYDDPTDDGLTVVSGEEYSVFVELGNRLITSGGRMYASLESFQDTLLPFPGDGFGWSSGQNSTFWEFPNKTAPLIEYTDEAAPLYVACLFETSSAEWTDTENPGQIKLCVPNRYLGESLHQVTVTPPPPPEGSVDLVIQ